MRSTMTRAISVLALPLVAACQDPLPADVQWLAGRWRWTQSCCGISGIPDSADTPDALVLDFHHNGEVVVYRDGVETLRTRFDVDISDEGTLVRFAERVLYGEQFRINRPETDRITLQEFPQRCVDCPDRHGFVRAP